MLLKLKGDIIKAMNNGDVSICVAADYSKAFDTIKYDELLKHLYQLNFSKSFLKIIHSYLLNRKQYVQFDDKKSRTETIQAGVPQGSILGPILFNLHVSEMLQQMTPPFIHQRRCRK